MKCSNCEADTFTCGGCGVVVKPWELAEPSPRPVIDREALAKALDKCTCLRPTGSPHVLPRPSCPYHGDTTARVDAVMELARPMPTEVEIAEHVRQIFINGGAHRTHAQEAASEIADAMMKLLNGSGS